MTEKPYQTEYFLPLDLPDELGKIHQPPLTELTNVSLVKRLALLLHHTLGVIRYEVGSPRPVHRPVPSPRCMYASEIYVCLGEYSFCPKVGVGRYHPMKHCLEIRRSKGRWGVLEAALGFSLKGADAVLVVSADFWRIAHLYGDFAYHLAMLEAGHTRGHLVLLARQMGWKVSWHDRFIDLLVIDWLGLNEKVESPVSIIVLWREKVDIVPVSKNESADALKKDPSPWEDGLNQCKDLLDMMRFSRLERLEPLQPVTPRKSGEEEEGKTFILQPESGKWRKTEWLELVRSRSGGNDLTGMMADWAPLDFGDLSLVLDTCLRWMQRDIGDREGIYFYLWVNRVTGLSPGCYRLYPGKLVQQSLPPNKGLQELSTYPAKIANLYSLPVSLFVTVDYPWILKRYGDRGYAIVQQKVGHLSQYMALAAAGMGWILRPVKSFEEFRVEESLNLLPSYETVVYQLLIGRNRLPFLGFDMSL